MKIELENLTVAYEKLNVIAFFFQNHSILLSKLQIYGCSSSTVQWLTSYLSDRSQCTIRVHYLTLCRYLSVFGKEAFLVLFSFYYS